MSALQRQGTFGSAANGGGPRIELTSEEKRMYAQLFRQCDPEGLGVVTGDVARTLFERSGLAQATLGEIWQLADTDNTGFLTQVGFSQALRLIGHAQAGRRPDASLVDQAGPLPSFDGRARQVSSGSIGGAGTGSPAPGAGPPLGPQGTGGGPVGQVRIPPLTPQNRQKYLQLFERSAPGGFLDGDKARDIFLKAKLPNETLGQIWNLTDVQGKGSLTQTEFVVAMHLIQSVLNRQLPRVPNSLPPTLFDVAAGRQVMRGSFRPSSQNSSRQASLSMQATGGSAAGRMSPAVALPRAIDPAISPQEKTRFDGIFDTLDKARTGTIGAGEVVPFLTTSKLSEEVLAQVWDLADLHNTGQFGKTEFAIAMFLVQQKLAGRELPQTLPQSVLASAEDVPSVFQPGGVSPQPQQNQFQAQTQPQPQTQGQAQNKNQAQAQASGQKMNDDLMQLNDIFSAPSPPVANFTPPAPASRQFVPTSSFGQHLAKQNEGQAPASGSGSGSPMSPPGASAGTTEVQAPKPQSATGANETREFLADNEVGGGSGAGGAVAGAVTAGVAAGAAGAAVAASRGSESSGPGGDLGRELMQQTNKNAHIEQERARAEDELASVLNTKKETEAKLAALRSSYDAEALKIHQSKEALVTTQAQNKELQNQLSLVEASLGALQTEHSKVHSELQVSQEQNAALAEKLRATKEQVETLQAEIEGAQREAEERRQKVAAQERELAAAEKERTQLQKQLEDLRLSEREAAAAAAPVASGGAATAGAPVGVATGAAAGDGTSAPQEPGQKTVESTAESKAREPATAEPPSQLYRGLSRETLTDSSEGAQAAAGTLNEAQAPTQAPAPAPAPAPAQAQSQTRHMTAAEAVAAAAAGAAGVGGGAAALASNEQSGGLGNPFSKFVRPQYDYGGAQGVASPPSTAPARSSTLNTDDTPGSSPATSEFQGGMYNAPPSIDGDSTGATMPTFTLPIARPGSATSSVQNNAPLSVRGDLDGSRPESPAYSTSDAGPLSGLSAGEFGGGGGAADAGSTGPAGETDELPGGPTSDSTAPADSTLGNETERGYDVVKGDGTSSADTAPAADKNANGADDADKTPELSRQPQDATHTRSESQDYESANDSFEFVDAEDTSALPGGFPTAAGDKAAAGATPSSGRGDEFHEYPSVEEATANDAADESSDDDVGPESAVPQRPAGYERTESTDTRVGFGNEGIPTARSSVIGENPAGQTGQTSQQTSQPAVAAQPFDQPSQPAQTQPAASQPVDDDPFASAFSGLADAKAEDPAFDTTTDNFDDINTPFGTFPDQSTSSPFGAGAATTTTNIPANNDEWDELFADFPSGSAAATAEGGATTASAADINDAFSTDRSVPAKPQSPHSRAVADLVGMGFSRADALDALHKKDYNVAEATNYLLDK